VQIVVEEKLPAKDSNATQQQPRALSLPRPFTASQPLYLSKMAALGEDLLGIVNKLQDLVFNTIGNDSLDLPQIVCQAFQLQKQVLIYV
jgi:hypothetical protein